MHVLRSERKLTHFEHLTYHFRYILLVHAPISLLIWNMCTSIQPSQNWIGYAMCVYVYVLYLSIKCEHCACPFGCHHGKVDCNRWLPVSSVRSVTLWAPPLDLQPLRALSRTPHPCDTAASLCRDERWTNPLQMSVEKSRHINFFVVSSLWGLFYRWLSTGIWNAFEIEANSF
jgi:hypothetical protein